MTATVRALITSHVLVFAAGFVAGKMINEDELEMYREAHDNILSKARRKAATLGLGVVAIGVVVVGVKLMRRK